MPAFQGTLKSNEIYSAIYNMIISQRVFSDNIAGTNSKLVDAAKVDGTLYGDTKLYYATDALASSDWLNDEEATNLLQLHRPSAPSCQAITIDKFRQIPLTVDQYLSKRAWSDQAAFSQFNSVMLGWLGDTKRIYDSTTYNCFIGNDESATGKQTQDVTLSGITQTGEEKNRLRAQMIAEKIANILVEMTDVSRDYNDYGYLRSYNIEGIKIVFNSKYANEITKLDLPTIFHKDNLVDKFNQYVLPERYFGNINTSSTKGDGSTVRSLIEQVIGNNHYFAGDLIKTTDTAPADTSYTQKDDIICKIFIELPPYMSGFETSTDFFNPKSLTDTHFLTFGRNSLEHLKNYPIVTLYED